MSIPEVLEPMPVISLQWFRERVRGLLAPTKGPVGWSDARRLMESLYADPLASRKTRYKMRGALADLEAVVESPGNLDTESIARLVVRLHGRNLAPASINSVLRTARTLTNLFVREGWIERSPFAGRKFRVRECRQPNRHLSVEQMRALFTQADEEATIHERNTKRWWLAHRLRALVYTLAFTGIRAMEALTLRWADVDLQAKVLRVAENIRGKTAGSRAVIPVPQELADVLTLWRPVCRSEWVFPKQRDHSRCWINGSIKFRPLGAVKALGARAGIEGVTMLIFRHSWATHARLAWGLTAEQVRAVLRHTTERTQEHYLHDDVADLRAIGDRVSY